MHAGKSELFLTERDGSAMGVVVIAAAIAGLSGSAIANAPNAASTEEDATTWSSIWMEKPQRAGYGAVRLKRVVLLEVAAEWRHDHYEAAGIAIPACSLF